jgi:type IV pilus assembly protein PilB
MENLTHILPPVAKALVGAKLFDSKSMQDILRNNPKMTGVEILESVVAKGISTADVAKGLSDSLGFPLFDLEVLANFPVNHPYFNDLLKNGVLLLCDRQNALFVAVADPTDEILINKMRHLTGRTLRPVLVEYDKLKQFQGQLGSNLGQVDVGGDDVLKLDEINPDADAAAALANDEGDVKADDSPIVKFLQKVIFEAVSKGASDLHFEAYEKFYRVRFRADGELQEFIQPPLGYKSRIASRIKVMSNLDISERRLPQDGRMRIRFSENKVVDFRVSTMPTLYGEKIVIRVLDGSSANIGIDALGYSPKQKELLLGAIHRPYGMVLVTGPTGSGKTVSLYNCLNILNKPGINISTAEDPSEIQLAGINQVNVNDKIGLSFASVLRAFLRQDPDVIMVGEIRDYETADIAIKAAQTGHMVLSTLHTNDAPKTLTRLANMGVPAFNIAASVILITAQRLGRKLCSKCKVPVKYDIDQLREIGFPEEHLDTAKNWTPYKAVGCAICNSTGYKGRVGFYQVMPVSEVTQKLILDHATDLQIAEQAAKEGVKTMRQSGLDKVVEGLTSIEEVVSVTNE